MDVYHIVLAKLCEVTEGKEAKPVDFKDLVKNAGYFGNYADIFDKLSHEGWIAEDKKEDFVRITHWGAAEVKKTAKQGVKNISHSLSIVSRAKTEAAELENLIDELSKDISKENFVAVERKMSELTDTLGKIKQSL